jgi:hypothetical protein
MVNVANNCTSSHFPSAGEDNIAFRHSVVCQLRSLLWRNSVPSIRDDLSSYDVHRINQGHTAFHIVVFVKQRPERASYHLRDLTQLHHWPVHDSIAFNSANPAPISLSNFSISAMISRGGRCSTSS